MSKVFGCDLQLRWSDQDVNGHVNNARLLTVIEEVRLRAILAWGLEAPRADEPRVVRSLNAVFERPVHYGAGLDGRAWVASVGRTSFTVGHELLQHQLTCVRAEAVIVRLDPSTQRPRPLEDRMRTALEERVHAPSVDISRSATREW